MRKKYSSVTCDADVLRGAILAVLPATNRDAGRYELDCVRLRAGDGGVRAEATDGRRLAISGACKPKGKGALIERKSARALCKTLRKLGIIELDISSRDRLRWRPMSQKRWRVVAVPRYSNGEDRSDELRFPDTDDMLPTGRAVGTMLVTVDELKTTARQAWTCTSDEYPAVTFTLAPESVRAHSECSEACFDRDVEAQYHGEPMTVSYNPRMIEDGIRQLKGKDRTITVAFFGALSSAVMLIREPERTYLLAPVAVRESSQWSEEVGT
jgi:DNA polymerase III sliding clamp (beta) subunit (PCNA family)